MTRVNLNFKMFLWFKRGDQHQELLASATAVDTVMMKFWETLDAIEGELLNDDFESLEDFDGLNLDLSCSLRFESAQKCKRFLTMFRTKLLVIAAEPETRLDEYNYCIK